MGRLGLHVCLFVCLFVCWVIYFKVASILAAYLRYTRLRDPNHPSPAMPAYNLHCTCLYEYD